MLFFLFTIFNAEKDKKKNNDCFLRKLFDNIEIYFLRNFVFYSSADILSAH